MRNIMKRNTMKWRILKYNIIVILGFMTLTTIVFNIAIRLYIENDISHQLHNIAIRAEDTALRKGPAFLSKEGVPPLPKDKDPFGNSTLTSSSKSNQIFEFYFMLDRSLRETSSVLNADYLLIDSNKEIINTPKDGYFSIPENLLNKINGEFYIDLPYVIKKDLIELGLKTENIVLANICTVCNSDICFSYRVSTKRKDIDYATMGAFVELK